MKNTLMIDAIIFSGIDIQDESKCIIYLISIGFLCKEIIKDFDNSIISIKKMRNFLNVTKGDV